MSKTQDKTALARRHALCIYLAGALGQIWAVCITVFILRRLGLTADMTTSAGIIPIAVGGISSALWGTILSVKHKGRKPKEILKGFFDVRQSIKSYLLVLMFLFLDFLSLFFGGSFSFEHWYTPIILFAQALLFGGIEEIGWRYFFQPVLQEKQGYIVSALITFVMWGIWHFSYFYIAGALPLPDTVPFLVGLLVNSFILSALYIQTNSLWICVMTHSLINMLSQTAQGGSTIVQYICRAVIVVIAVLLSTRKSNHTKTDGKEQLI